jgi:NADPH:quinone reductase-like Zn-dependent oxidoreductase
MRRVAWTKYGPPEVLELTEVDTPRPKDNEILIRIQATTVTAGDCEQRELRLPFLFKFVMRAYVGIRRPSRVTSLGMELAGEVEEVGADVTEFGKGDRVFAATGLTHTGTYADYTCLPVDSDDVVIGRIPENLSYIEAAPVPVGGMDALYYLRQGAVGEGDRIAINGAGGTIGCYAVQLAKHFGAHVTAVDSTSKLEMLQSIGADSVVDYTKEDFTERNETYSFILDLPSKAPFSAAIQSLTSNGTYIFTNGSLATSLRGRWTSIRSDKKVLGGGTWPKTADLTYLAGLLEAGTIKTVIDRTFSLEEVVEAHRYVEAGGKKGNIVLVVNDDDEVV